MAESKGDINIFVACQRGQLMLLKELISAGQPINGFDISNKSPLHHAVAGGHFDCVEWLLKNGANPDCKSKGEDQMTPLHQVSDDAVCELLISFKANVNSRDGWGFSPLHTAAREGRTLVAQCLISHGARLNSPDDMKRTPLHLAAQFGKVKICNLLVNAGANVHLFEAHARTPLKCAETFYEMEAARYLRQAEEMHPKEDYKEHLGAPVHELIGSPTADLRG